MSMLINVGTDSIGPMIDIESRYSADPPFHMPPEEKVLHSLSGSQIILYSVFTQLTTCTLMGQDLLLWSCWFCTLKQSDKCLVLFIIVFCDCHLIWGGGENTSVCFILSSWVYHSKLGCTAHYFPP